MTPLYVLAAQDAPPGLGEIECSYSTIVSRCLAMPTSEMGQKAKYSSRAHVFRFASDNGHAVAAPQ